MSEDESVDEGDDIERAVLELASAAVGDGLESLSAFISEEEDGDRDLIVKGVRLVVMG
jgi:hypothetical protein